MTKKGRKPRRVKSKPWIDGKQMRPRAEPAPVSPQEFPSHGHTIMGCPSYVDGAPCPGTITDKVVEVRDWMFGKLGKLEPCPYCGRQLSISLSLDVVA